MRNLFKTTVLTVALFFATMQLHAQVQFSLSLLADEQTYMVSLIPETTIASPLNMTSNAQIVVKIPLDKPFLAGELQSLTPGVEWTDNAIMDQAGASPEYTLCAFTMVQTSTKDIVFEEGVEIPLFTFKNMESTCAGGLELPDNNDPVVVNAVSEGFNFTQNMTVLAARGNAFTGVINAVDICSSDSSHEAESEKGNTPDTTEEEGEQEQEEEVLPEEETEANPDLIAYPVPTHKTLTIEWTNAKDYKNLKLDVFRNNGEKIHELDLDPTIGAKKIEISVEQYTAGLYSFYLRNQETKDRHYKFIVARH